MRQATCLAVPILAIIVGCGETLPTPNQNAGRNVATPAPERPIPDDVTYTVIEESTFHNIKREALLFA